MRWCTLALCLLGCGRSPAIGVSAADLAVAMTGAYACTVEQTRCGGCAEPWPRAFSGGSGTTFAMTITGSSVDVPGWFHCDGTWSGALFVCMIAGGSCTNSSCGMIPWAILTSGAAPNDSVPLQPGQLWAGTYVPGQPSGNGFNALCSR